MTKARKEPAIALKDVMSAIDKKDRGFYNRLSEEQKKAFSAWMMMRYTSSAQGRNAAHYVFMVNELVNKNFSDTSKHPELQWLLLSACGSGKVEFHPYIKPPNARKKKDKVSEFVYSIYPHLKRDELELFFQLNTKEDLVELAKANGYDDKTIADIFGK
jgi:hypothetical protein